ncbi:hypothetical protein NG796_01555 [Laspinema sp. A4]|uniref:hypothetical protein n=1 Tax=Laspinema sp. D2d TaxID=2953686 RepID=UPI0021BACCAB|nr:hypothetical protein [Laspinema sp. D2d]MCT7981973.1 hypothetical protein [Laspinema sp. D2d]
MNIKLVESLAQVVQSLSPEERSLFEEKLKAQQEQTSAEGKERPFYETATPVEWAKAFREWAESHPRNQPYLSDEAISRESIYGERG